jgi:two-component system response regulator LytT
MNILIVEDEEPIAKYIEKSCHRILGDKISKTYIRLSLPQAMELVQEKEVDVCLLDLNLNGKSGFDLLKEISAQPFHTIIVSANKDRAIEAFEYGVIDFVPKPFDDDRLKQAFDRFMDKENPTSILTKFISFRKGSQIETVEIDQIEYFKAAGVYVEAHLQNGKSEIIDKSMDKLLQILPLRFFRIHRSYIIDLNHLASFKHAGGGIYEVHLQNGETLPLSRQKYKELQSVMNY